MRLLLGLLKGIIIGGAVGYAALRLNMQGGLHWITYGVVGALVGILVGRPIWSVLTDQNSTIWTVVLKAAFGFGVGALIYAVIGQAWGPDFELSIDFLAPGARRLHDWQPLFGAIVGGLYGMFVEFDDAPSTPPSSSSKTPPTSAP